MIVDLLPRKLETASICLYQTNFFGSVSYRLELIIAVTNLRTANMIRAAGVYFTRVLKNSIEVHYSLINRVR